jgi:hypothetical protein
VNTNWGNADVVGCPLPGGRTAFLYSIANAGAAKFLAMSVAKTGSIWSFDTITNGPGNTPSPVAIPVPCDKNWPMYCSRRIEQVHVIAWTPLTSAQLRGYYDWDPGANLVTGYAIRYWQGSSAPTNFSTSAWTLAGVVEIGLNGTDPGEALISAPWTSGLVTYVAFSVLFDGQAVGATPGLCETAFVGSPHPLWDLVPGEIGGQGWTGKTRMTWTAWPDYGYPSYDVIRGQQPGLSHLLDSQADSCSLAWVNLIAYFDDASEPCPGEFYWFLVRGWMSMPCPWCAGGDEYMAGDWGLATAGPRNVNSSGVCATPDPCP